MDVLVAVGHIGGSIIAVVALEIGLLLFGGWETQRNQRKALENAALALGVTVEELDKEEFRPRLIEFSSARHSTELLRNRVSDLCGALRTVWGWLGSLLQIAILVGVVWYTLTDSLGTAIYAWWIVAVRLFVWLSGAAFSLICKFLTGRYPGEAKQARKALAQFIRDQRATKYRKWSQGKVESE